MFCRPSVIVVTIQQYLNNMSKNRLGIFLVAMGLLAHPAKAEQRTLLAQIGELGSERFFSQEGVFTFDERRNEFTGLSIASGGELVRVGGGESSGPSTARITSMAGEEKPYLLIRNLGLTKAQFIFDKGRISINEHYFLSHGITNFSHAFGLKVNAKDGAWFFDTKYLPPLLTARIPGSGIHVHLGQSRLEPAKIWEHEHDALLVRFKAAVPRYETSGKAVGQVSMGLGFINPSDNGGKGRSLELLVKVFHPAVQDHRDRVGSDTRNFFGSTAFVQGMRFITVRGEYTHSTPWDFSGDGSEFAGMVTYENMKNLLAAYNQKARQAGRIAKYSDNPADYYFRSVSIRNEIVRLDEGTLAMDVRVRGLEVFRVTP